MWSKAAEEHDALAVLGLLILKESAPAAYSPAITGPHREGLESVRTGVRVGPQGIEGLSKIKIRLELSGTQPWKAWLIEASAAEAGADWAAPGFRGCGPSTLQFDECLF
jgi:hypothetical protein